MKGFVFIILFFYCTLSQAQSLKKYPIGNSGCSFYTYCDTKFGMDYSSDSSKVYTGECEKDNVKYGVVCVKLLNPNSDLVMAEDLLIAYLDYLKGSFQIVKAVGYGRGQRLNNDESTRGIVDYWEDKDKNNWKIKAWTNGKFIGFLYAYSNKELPESKVNVFLESFRFPIVSQKSQ